MGSTFEIQLRRDDGQQIGIIDRFSLLQYALLTNDISACRIDLPGDFDKTLLAADRRLDIWRQPDGGSLSREGIWFIRKIKDSTDANGERNIKVTGYSPNYLLGSRIVAYAAASAQADKTAAFDNMMKAVVSQNLSTGATNTARTISTTYLSIAPNYTAAPSDNKAFAWRNVLAVLKDIADASRGAGTKLYFDMVPVDSTKFEFRTYTGQPGLDHTFPSGVNPVLLGLEYGNLEEPSVEWDWSEELSFVYGAGQGEEADRITSTVEDTARSGRSIFARREGFADARQYSTASKVQSAAYEMLTDKRPRLRFSGRIVDVPGTQYGIHWRHGDRVSAMYYGQQYDALIRSVQVWIDGDGKETITTRLETDDTTG